MAYEDNRDDLIVTSVRLERAKHQQLRVIAERDHRSVSQELRRLVDRRLREYDEEAA